MHPDHMKLLKKAQGLDRAQKPQEAAAAYRAFLALEPQHSDAWSYLAGKLLRLGDPKEAIKAARNALVGTPDHLAARINLGRALMQCDHPEEAELYFRSAIAADPQRLDAHLFLAECLLTKRALKDARRVLDAAGPLAAMPGRSPALLDHHAGLWAIYGMGLIEEQRFEDAEAACATALSCNGRNMNARTSLATIRMAQGRQEEAEKMLRGLVADHPQNMDLRIQLVGCLAQRGDFVAADQEAAKAIQEDPRDLTVHWGITRTHYAFGRWPEFDAEIARFRAVDPSSLHPDLEQSFADLLFGDFRQGWARHESRLKIHKELWPAYQPFLKPTWDGGPFQGKTLLLWAEQGFGDTLMFLRYLPMVKALGGQVLLDVPPALMAVAATCEGVDAVVPGNLGGQAFDLHIPLHSLPWLFRTELTTIPGEIPYIQVPGAVPRREEICAQLALAGGNVRIGLVWAGNPLHARDAQRSLPADALAPLGVLPGVSWFSLQLRREEVPPLPDLISLAPFLTNFSDTAFALCGLDLLITVDTAVAHLAGALGIPTLLLLTFQPDFRWLLDRTDSPWYPTLRLYRQPIFGDWSSVIRQVVVDLSTAS